MHAQSRRARVRKCRTSPVCCLNLAVRGSLSQVVLWTNWQYKTSWWCEVRLRPCSPASPKTRSLIVQTHDQHGAAPEVLRTCHLVPRTVLVSPCCLLGRKLQLVELHSLGFLLVQCHRRPPSASLCITPIAIRPRSSAVGHCSASDSTVSLRLRCTLARICLIFFFMYASTRLLY